MNNKDLPAFPVSEFGLSTGISERTLIAAMCLQGILANGRSYNDIKQAAEFAILVTDELLTQLNQQGDAK